MEERIEPHSEEVPSEVKNGTGVPFSSVGSGESATMSGSLF